MTVLIDQDMFIKVCDESNSMAKAAVILGLHFNTFKKYAIKFGCYKPNQGGKGLSKTKPKILTKEILDGLHPSYQTFKLKIRLLEEGIKENKCEICSLDLWFGKPLNMELDHIDGDRTNHRIDNLRMVCPNCHAQTDTFRAKNKSLNREIY